MIERQLLQTILDWLEQFPAVALLGPRQVGKTTLAGHLAKQMAEHRQALYLDLESPQDRERLADPLEYLQSHEDKLVILDEVQHLPEVFQVLRVLIDKGLPERRRNARFLLLGSASIDLLKQSGESLAGRIAFAELGPLDVLEVESNQLGKLWARGGFPNSFLAASERKSALWRLNFIRTYLERDIPQLGPRIPAETLRRFWTMLAHSQGGLLNVAHLARALAVDGKTVARYLDLLVDLLLVRRLPPYYANVGKRLVRSPKVYLRDSGVLHALLGLQDQEAVLSHPVAGGSWEGFVMENLVNRAPDLATAYFYRTAAGAEIDLLLAMPGGKLWAIEIKRSLSPKIDKGFHQACEDLSPDRRFIVYSGEERYRKAEHIEVISLPDMMREITAC